MNEQTQLYSMGKIRKFYPEYYREVLIKLKDCIIDIFSFYKEELEMENFKMILAQVEEIGRYLTGADIDIFKKNCLAGKYELRFRLTPPVFIDWLKTYINDRGEEFANANHIVKKEHDRVKFNPQAIEKISEIFKPKEDEIQLEEKKVDPVQKLVNTFIKDFKENCKDEIETKMVDRYGETQTYLSQCREYIEYEGKNLGINEYIAARYENFYNNIMAEYATAKTDLRFDQYFKEKIK